MYRQKDAYLGDFFHPVLEKRFETDIPILEKSMHKVSIFHHQDLFWNITGFWDGCSGIFTEILDRALKFLLKIETLKVGTLIHDSLIWKCHPPPPRPAPEHLS